jgi:flagellar basal-body rod protein FlgB
MDIQSIPLFAMLRSRMGYLDQRQQVIAQNVANASTPGFTPKDLKPFTVQASGTTLALAPVAQTEPGHMAGVIALDGGQSAQGSSDYKPVNAPDSDTTLDGNQVVLEDEMLKMSQTRSDYDVAVGIYQKAMSFLQLAAQEPGKGA